LNQNRDADKLSVGVAKFVVEVWFVIKLVGVLFVAEKNKGRRRNEVRSSGHKSNITNEFIDEFKSVGNLICKNDTSSYFLTFFSFFFSPPYFSQYILREYFCQCLPMNLIREYSIDKIHHNLLINFFFYQCFYLYLLIFW